MLDLAVPMHYLSSMARVNPETRVCSLDGCSRLLYARGWCRPHWARHIRSGDLDLQDRGRPWTFNEHRLCMNLPTDRSGTRAARDAVITLAKAMGRTRGALSTRRNKYLKQLAKS